MGKELSPASEDPLLGEALRVPLSEGHAEVEDTAGTQRGLTVAFYWEACHLAYLTEVHRRRAQACGTGSRGQKGSTK